MSDMILLFSGILFGSLGYFLFIRFRVLSPLKRLHAAVHEFADHPLSEVPQQAKNPSINSARFFHFLNEHFNQHHQHSEDFYQALQQLHQHIQQGHFKERLEGHYNKGHTAIQQEVNAILETFEQQSNAITQGLKRFADGQFDHPIEQQIRGNMAKEYNRTAQNLQETIHQIHHAMQALEKGNYDHPIELNAPGYFKKIENDINHIIASTKEMLSEAIQGLSALSSGELSRRVNENGYHGLDLAFIESINNALANLGSMIAEVHYGTDHFKQGANEMNAASVMLAEKAEHQASQISDITQALEGMEQEIAQSANKAVDAEQLSNQTQQEVQNGTLLMQRTIQAMEKISEASGKIEEIIELIDSIAFQTNLLALNAAVEAARAGNHGRGFAVVAGEVRNLAQKSAEAAQNIKHLIEMTGEQIADGAELVNHTGEALTKVNQGMSHVSQLIAEMAQLSLRQKSHIQHSLTLVTEVDHDAQTNASISEETASAAYSFNEQAINLSHSIEKFKIDQQQLHLQTTLSTGDFTFARARRAHRAWVGRIRGYINGIDVGIHRTEATDAQQCELGRWLSSNPQAQQTPSFSELDTLHTELHQNIGLAMQAIELHDKVTAETHLSNIHRLSEQVIEALDTLEMDHAQKLYSGVYEK